MNLTLRTSVSSEGVSELGFPPIFLSGDFLARFEVLSGTLVPVEYLLDSAEFCSAASETFQSSQPIAVAGRGVFGLTLDGGNAQLIAVRGRFFSGLLLLCSTEGGPRSEGEDCEVKRGGWVLVMHALLSRAVAINLVSKRDVYLKIPNG